MTPRVGLRIAVVAEWCFVVAAIGLEYSQRDSLPEELKAYLASVAEPDTAVGKTLLLASVGILVLAAGLVSSIGLLFFKRWARSLYLAATVIQVPLALGFGPVVTAATAYVAGEVQVFWLS